MNFTNLNKNIVIYFKEIRNFENLTRKDELILFTRVANGDNEAVTEIFNRTSKLAVAIAKTYTSNPDVLQDLIQEANCGILEAIKRFDPDSGFRFSSYARYWMKAFISKYINEMGIVHPTSNSLLVISKKIREQFFIQNGRDITDYELMDILEQKGYVVTDITAILSVKVDSISEVYGEEDCLLEDSKYFNEKTASYNNSISQEKNAELAGDIARMLTRLTDRERTMVKMKFSIGYDHELTNTEIAKAWALMSGEKVMTDERVRQIITGALKKLKNL